MIIHFSFNFFKLVQSVLYYQRLLEFFSTFCQHLLNTKSQGAMLVIRDIGFEMGKKIFISFFPFLYNIFNNLISFLALLSFKICYGGITVMYSSKQVLHCL